jgi:hypothetical protein
MSKNEKPMPLRQFSPITALVCWLFNVARWLTFLHWRAKKNPHRKARNKVTEEELNKSEYTRWRALWIEGYVILWIAVESVAISMECMGLTRGWLPLVLIFFALWRILDIVQYAVNTTLFDGLSGRPDNCVASRARMIVLAGVNYIELCACFGIIYAAYCANQNCCHLSGAGSPLTAFYFSIITQLTIGYGDVHPMGWLRIVAAAQGLIGTIFVVLVFARLVAALPQIKGVLDKDGPKQSDPARTSNE